MKNNKLYTDFYTYQIEFDHVLGPLVRKKNELGYYALVDKDEEAKVLASLVVNLRNELISTYREILEFYAKLGTIAYEGYEQKLMELTLD